jgi:hypothetical protein
LCFVSFPLQVDELLNARLYKDMMAPSYTLLKAQIDEEFTEIIEADVGIGSSPKDPVEKCLLSRHARIVARVAPSCPKGMSPGYLLKEGLAASKNELALQVSPESWLFIELVPDLAPDLPALPGVEGAGKRARLAQLVRKLATFNEEGRNGGGVAGQDLRPLPGVERRLSPGRHPLLDAPARLLDDLRLVPQPFGDGPVIRYAPFLGEAVKIHGAKR